MDYEKTLNFLKKVIDNMPDSWLKLTTHRLDIYNEDMAKTEFLNKLEEISKQVFENESILKVSLESLPTAFDYIRLGHPLSCLLEWVISKKFKIKNDNVVSFSSEVMPLMAILRKNLLAKTKTQVLYESDLPEGFDSKTIKEVYGYSFHLEKLDKNTKIKDFEGSTIVLSSLEKLWMGNIEIQADFYIGVNSEYGSVVVANGENQEKYISEIQHVRRRESNAMIPIDCLRALEKILGKDMQENQVAKKEKLIKIIKDITKTSSDPVIGSCGLSIQYAIMMGLVESAMINYPNKKIKFIVPPNCYGGTNDQARRVAACIERVEILDLPVDNGRDMVQGVESILEKVAIDDAIAYIVAEIPTNPRVEIPDLLKLRESLLKPRRNAVKPVFILDQTFCPNVEFFGENGIFKDVQCISYVSGSKFPSGGLCTAGYCVASEAAKEYIPFVDKHLKICSNQARDFQVQTLIEQMPSMNSRIDNAYKNTQSFVDHIMEILPESKINFVSKDLVEKTFTPSVFSLDLPTKGNTALEKEEYKRCLNLKLINMMIKEIPDESKYCVSYGQLKGSYWTIPATSTQGTTKEGDKDYIVRVSMSPDLDLEKHKEVFSNFVSSL